MPRYAVPGPGRRRLTEILDAVLDAGPVQERTEERELVEKSWRELAEAKRAYHRRMLAAQEARRGREVPEKERIPNPQESPGT